MKEQNLNYCVILAGGKGRRLWPCSRDQWPKQFIDFFGMGRTLLQHTYDRFARLLPKENIYVVTNEDYENIVRKQLPELTDEQLLSEPIHRGTAPSMIWASHRILNKCRDARILVTPSDLTIVREDRFEACLERAFEFVAANDYMLTMGVKPTRPEPGYGYIQLGEECQEGVHKVKSFTEKPEREFARMFMEMGEFYWNTGMFLANARCALDTLYKLVPSVLRTFDAEHPEYDYVEENKYIKKNFPSYPNLSIDFGVLERSNNVCVMCCDFGWADLGTWHSMYEALSKGEGDNVAVDTDVVLDNAHGNIIKLPKGRLAVISNLDGYIIAEEGNVLFIGKKEDSSADIRRIVNDIQIKKGNEFI